MISTKFPTANVASSNVIISLFVEVVDTTESGPPTPVIVVLPNVLVDEFVIAPIELAPKLLAAAVEVMPPVNVPAAATKFALPSTVTNVEAALSPSKSLFVVEPEER